MERRRAVTLEDVARAAGVSRATVSRVVRRDPAVASQTARRVDAAVAQLGYVPNGAAQLLATGRSNTLAIVVPEPDRRVFSDPFFGLVVGGINEGLVATGMQVVMVFAPTRGGPDATVRFLLEGRMAGAVVVSHHRSDGLLEATASLPIPTVFLGKPFRPVKGEMPHYVDSDNERGGELAGQRLLATGVTRPAVVSGPRDMTAAVDRLNGCRRVLNAAGMSPPVVFGDFTAERATKLMGELFASHPEIDGVFAASDLMALGAMKAMKQRGLRVGEDIKLIGFDNFEAARQAEPPLTTVSNPAVELGREAARMVVALVSGDEVPRQKVLPVRLVVRQSG